MQNELTEQNTVPEGLSEMELALIEAMKNFRETTDKFIAKHKVKSNAK